MNDAPAIYGQGQHALIDTPINNSKFGRVGTIVLMTLGVLFVSGILAVLATVLIPSTKITSAVFPFIFLPTLLGLYYYLYRLDIRHVKEVIQNSERPTDHETLRRICTGSLMSGGMQLRTAAQELFSRGCNSVAFRCCSSDQMNTIVPIDLYFEPMPLDESTPQFASLDTGNGPSFDTDAELFKKKLHRNIAFGGGWRWGMFQFLPLVIAALIAITRRRVSFELVAFAVSVSVMLFGIGGRGAWRPKNQWLLVPGGVVFRRIRFLKSNWDVHLFERTKSVLILYSSWARLWTIAVANQSNHAATMVTAAEARLLLRAWLSPLPTPPLEQLSDLT